MTPRAAITTLTTLALALGVTFAAAPIISFPNDPAFDRSVTLVARGNLTLAEGLTLISEAIGYEFFLRDIPDVPLEHDFATARPANVILDILLRLYDLDTAIINDALVIGPTDRLASFQERPEATDTSTREYRTLDPDGAQQALALLYPDARVQYLEALDALYVTAAWFEHDEITALIANLDDRAAQRLTTRDTNTISVFYELPSDTDAQGLERLLRDIDPSIDATTLTDIGLIRVTLPPHLTSDVERVIDRLTHLALARAPTRVTYAIDNALAVTLQEPLQAALEAREIPATLIGDHRTNTLTVIATPDGHALIAELLRDLDQREQQVRIRIRIHEVSKTEAQRIGIDLSGRIGTFGASVGSDGLALAFNPGGALSPLTINGALDALEQQSLARSIDDANLLTLNNQVAILNSGGSIRLLATDDNAGQEIQFGTLVRVQPRISSDGFVTLTVDIELSGFEDEVSGGLRFTEQRVTSTVQVPDGGVAILGGLIRHGLTITEGGVPILRDIPIVGRAFRSNTDTREESELIMTIEVNLEDVRAPDALLLRRSAP